jgi:hypothetical protein
LLSVVERRIEEKPDARHPSASDLARDFDAPPEMSEKG